MSPAFAVLAQAIWWAVVSSVVSIAENMGAEAAFKRVTQAIAHHGLEQEVTDAVKRAFQRFVTQVRDPDLVTALERDVRFQTDKAVIQALGDAAIKPWERERQVQILTDHMQSAAPFAEWERCRSAAGALIDLVHEEVSSIKKLQIGLLLMQGKEILRVVEQGNTRPYAHGLRQAIIARADALQRELGHNYIVSAHLLYALMTLPTGVARSVLEHHGVTPEQLKAAIRSRIKPYTGPILDGMSTGAASALDEAQQLARQRNAPQTRDDHLLEVLTMRVLNGGEGSTSLSAVFKVLGLSATTILAEDIQAGQVESQIQSSLDVMSGEIPLS